MSLTLTNNPEKAVIEIRGPIYDPQAAVYFELQFKINQKTDWITVLRDDRVYIPGSSDFKVDFPYCANNVDYKFRIAYFDENDELITDFLEEALVHSCFTQNLILDQTEKYNILYNWGIPSYSHSNYMTSYNPFNSRYVKSNKTSRLDYSSAHYSVLFLNDTNPNIDEIAQRRLKESFENWATDGGAKFIKLLNGETFLVCINQEINSSFYKELANELASSQFSWVEVGDSIKDLQKFNMCDNLLPLLV